MYVICLFVSFFVLIYIYIYIVTFSGGLHKVGGTLGYEQQVCRLLGFFVPVK